jgi:hypothetical protein
MDFGSINWLAVIVCVIVSMIVGTLWYNPRTFYPVWHKVVVKDDQSARQSMDMVWTLTILSSFVQAVAMAFMVNSIGGLMSSGISAGTGMMIGFMIWLGFIAPTYLVNKLFAGQGLKIWAIEAGNHLVNFLLFGAILGAWR